MALDSIDGAVDSQPDADKGSPSGGKDTKRDAAAASAPAKRLGPLLDKPKEKAARIALALFTNETTKKNFARRDAKWMVNYLRRQGLTHVRLQKSDQNLHEWQVYIPPGSAATPPTLNKAARLCRRLNANMLVDPPVCEATPSSDTDEDREAAEFSTRVLEDVESESGANNLKSIRESFDSACTYGSGFRYHYVDPHGGGQRPQQIEASPNATLVSDPLNMAANNGQPDVAEPILRYVAKDGKTITNDASEATLQWLPKLKHRVYTPRNIRLVPEQCRGLSDADGIVLAEFETWGKLKTMYEGLEDLEPEDLAKVTWKPQKWQSLVPRFMPRGEADNSDPKTASPDQKGPPDDALIFHQRVWYEEGPQYPRGCYVCLLGDAVLVKRGTLEAQAQATDVDGDNDVAPECRMVPFDQFRMFNNGDEDPYGDSLMDLLGSGNELRGMLYGSLIEHLDRFNRRKVFYPITSTLQPKSMQNPQGTYIPINPGGQPHYEEIPEYPRSSTDMLDRITVELDDESGLSGPAQGNNPPDVNSGLHAQQLIEQSNVGLSGVKQNLQDALERGWRIDLQLVRLDYTIEQRIGWVDDDGEYKQESFVGSDLGSTKDVRLQRGSFTLLSPSAKAAVAQTMFQMGVLDKDELKRVTWGNVGGLLGLEDNPHLLRIRRQLNAWRDGPPDEASPEEYTDLLAKIFEARQVDDLPGVAPIRFIELSRFMSGSRYYKWPPEWRMGIDQEYTRARKACGIVTLEEQQQSQAQQNAAQTTVLESMKYADSPEDVKRQFEEKLGFQPSQLGGVDPMEQQKQAMEAQATQAKTAAQIQQAHLKGEIDKHKASAGIEAAHIKGQTAVQQAQMKHQQAMELGGVKHAQAIEMAQQGVAQEEQKAQHQQNTLQMKEAADAAKLAGTPA